ncbi:MAG: tRNA epoxyqueuosine(34) reductase QueG [Candidatus Kapabacteria bacterium]|jgi:epoxyqueuosine reductase|nr:tRNA epoxyqueuosine(34) reductase QueG [Candidatus Kapabacteria bacterium]
MNDPILKQEIINKTKSLGFCLTGFASAEPMREEADKLAEWIEAGKHGDMHFLQRHLDMRADIDLLLPGAQTVIVCAMSYNTGIKHPDNAGEKGLGKISSYAWGDDYHEVIKSKLRELVTTLETIEPESKNRIFVDTGPVPEKSWAERAGLGVRGKNTLLLNKEYGSSIFIGVIITTAFIGPDSEVSSICGTCTACIDACPTKALDNQGILDAGRCISFWTIEKKEPWNIPTEIAENMNDYLLGCDICRNVCPYNQKAKLSDRPEFLPRNGETCLVLDDVLEMTQEEFSKIFKNSNVKRLKLAGLNRNAKTIEKNNSED